MGSGPAGRWGPSARPRLATKVRLQWNAPRGQALLLFPEGALALNPTARAILELCDGRRTVSELVAELVSRLDGGAGGGEDVVRRDVSGFLERLGRRGWLVDGEAS